MSNNEVTLLESTDNLDNLSFSSQTDVPRTFNIRPQDGANCKIILETEYSGEMEYPIGKEIEFCLGESESPLGDIIEDKLRKLKEGDEHSFAVPVRDNGPDDEQTDTTVTTKLCQFENCVPAYQLSTEEKFERAKAHKENGVELFKRGKLEYAFRRFSKALKLLLSMLPEEQIPESISKEYETLKTGA